MNLLKEKKNIRIILIYGIFYSIAFVCLEKSGATPHLIHSVIDDYIPFCEYFIIPYILWFVFIVVTIGYFAFVCKEKKEYDQLISILITGMTVFLIVSYIYPNGQQLRPSLTEDSIFIKAVELLYFLDTPTNILPSLHVFNAIACCVAICRNSESRKHKGILIGTITLTIMIILSTVFLKQHSIIDVVLAFVFYAVCYQTFYKLLPRHYEKLSLLFTRKEILTIPNILSVFRLILAILFMGIFQRGGLAENKGILTAILIMSGISDFLDGKIARKYHMVSEVGKLLDPIADKVTQGALLFCFLSEYELAKGVFVLFLVKEGYILAAGTKSLVKTHKNEGAKWYGKVSTAVFYAVMTVLIIFPDIPKWKADVLIGCSGGFMLVALIMYAHYYKMLQKEV